MSAYTTMIVLRMDIGRYVDLFAVLLRVEQRFNGAQTIDRAYARLWSKDAVSSMKTYSEHGFVALMRSSLAHVCQS